MMDAIQNTYPDDFAHCYGCGRHNEHGHRIKTYPTDEGTATDHEPAPYYRGGGDSAYGGLIASVIDCHAAGSAAIFWMQRNNLHIGVDPAPRFVTARLEVDYVIPTPLRPWHLTGTAEEVGDRKVIVSTDLVADGKVTARGRAVLVRIVEPQQTGL